MNRKLSEKMIMGYAKASLVMQRDTILPNLEPGTWIWYFNVSSYKICIALILDHTINCQTRQRTANHLDIKWNVLALYNHSRPYTPVSV